MSFYNGKVITNLEKGFYPLMYREQYLLHHCYESALKVPIRLKWQQISIQHVETYPQVLCIFVQISSEWTFRKISEIATLRILLVRSQLSPLSSVLMRIVPPRPLSALSSPYFINKHQYTFLRNKLEFIHCCKTKHSKTVAKSNNNPGLPKRSFLTLLCILLYCVLSF